MKERHIALVVEDEKEIAEELVEILSTVHCEAVVTDNREEALAELEESGRKIHEQCHEPLQTRSPNLKDGIEIAIPGDRIGRRTRVAVGAKTIELPDFTLKVLLHLMVAQRKGEPVNKRDMGATDDQ